MEAVRAGTIPITWSTADRCSPVTFVSVSIDCSSLRRTPGVSDAIGGDEMVGNGEERKVREFLEKCSREGNNWVNGRKIKEGVIIT